VRVHMYKERSACAIAALGWLLSVGTATAGELDVYLEAVRVAHGLPALAAAVVLNGEIAAVSAVGTRVAGRNLPVTPDDRFHIGSNTKSMTATLAGMMVEEGLLSWDSTVGAVLGAAHPGMSASFAAASIEQLLSHSSGIPGDNEEIIDLYFNDRAFDDTPHALRSQLLDLWQHHELTIPEGSPFQYSNLGYLIAGMMIETASGTPWEQMMHERIFQPLGMNSAGLGAQGTIGVIDAAVGHRLLEDGSVVPMLWGNGADMPTVLGPAGNAHMSVLDYAIWAGWNAGEGQRGPDILAPATLAHIHAEHVQTPVRENPPPGTPATGGYGLGWGLVQFDWAERPLLTHNGSNSMNLARIVLDTERDLGIVVLTNFPGPAADMATGAVMAELFSTYGDR